MNSPSLVAHNPIAPPSSASLVLPADAPLAARTVLRLLERLEHGSLDVWLPDGTLARFGQAGRQPHASLHLADWSVCGRALRSGDIGFAEAYIDGGWTSPDLVALLQVFIANREAIESVIYGHWWGSLLHRVKHLLNRNTRAGSKKNIHAHYDLGNRFYRLWLDETMNYSSALFGSDLQRPTAQAQAAKLERALDALQLAPGQRLLEVGCGWGALAEAAARTHGAQVTGITLSTEQLDYARQRLERAGLAADLRLQDYRDLADAPYDAIASIEMFEAVGREWWGEYFAMLSRQLKTGGRACIQSIVIRDDLFERYARSTDFIQQYIFPGGMLPSREQFEAQAAKAGFDVVDRFAFGADYAETLRRWRVQFLSRERQVLELGFDTRFVRIWEFYLAYCQAAFATGNTDVVQFTLVKR
jgi:cyclopropane-fatty-acyl-phospholipid synthase